MSTCRSTAQHSAASFSAGRYHSFCLVCKVHTPVLTQCREQQQQVAMSSHILQVKFLDCFAAVGGDS
jgi:hypothetical protein